MRGCVAHAAGLYGLALARSGGDGLDVEAHVVERQRLARRRARTASANGSRSSSGQPREVRAEGDRRGEVARARAASPASAPASSAPRRSRRRAGAASVSSAPAKFHIAAHALEVRRELGPRARPRRDRLRRARRRCPRRRTGRPGGRRAAAPRAGARRARSWSGIQWKVAVEKIRSTGSSSSQLGEVGDDVGGARRRARSRAFAIIASEPSTAISLPVGQPLDQLGGDPAGAAAGVERRSRRRAARAARAPPSPS